jgi:hypothetical protein
MSPALSRPRPESDVSARGRYTVQIQYKYIQHILHSIAYGTWRLPPPWPSHPLLAGLRSACGRRLSASLLRPSRASHAACSRGRVWRLAACAHGMLCRHAACVYVVVSMRRGRVQPAWVMAGCKGRSEGGLGRGQSFSCGARAGGQGVVELVLWFATSCCMWPCVAKKAVCCGEAVLRPLCRGRWAAGSLVAAMAASAMCACVVRGVVSVWRSAACG